VAAVAAPLVLALAMTTRAEAGFLEDLFGSNDVRPDPRIDAPGLILQATHAQVVESR
jgi:hypothetical protein